MKNGEGSKMISIGDLVGSRDITEMMNRGKAAKFGRGKMREGN